MKNFKLIVHHDCGKFYIQDAATNGSTARSVCDNPEAFIRHLSMHLGKSLERDSVWEAREERDNALRSLTKARQNLMSLVQVLEENKVPKVQYSEYMSTIL